MFPFGHSCFISLKLPVRLQNNPPPPRSFSTCWLIPKDSLRPIYQLLYPPASPMGRVWAGPSPGVLPCLPTPSRSRVQLLYPMKTQAKPFSGLNQEIQKWHIKQRKHWVAGQRGENRALSPQEIATELSKAPALWETFPGFLHHLFYLYPFNKHFKNFLSPRGKKLQLNFHFLFNL